MTNSSENIFDRRFWLGQADARIFALLRIALGVLFAADLADRLRDFHAFYTPSGLAPPIPPWPTNLLLWSGFNLPASNGATLAVFLSGFVLAGAFAVGYRTRLAGVLLWAFVVSLSRRNPTIADGGDLVIQVLLFWCLFADLGACLSVDVWLQRRPRRALIAAAPLRFLQLQVALIYLVTAFAKQGPTWRGGHAVGLAVSSSDWARGLGPALAQHPAICTWLTYTVLVIEITFAFLVLSPWRTALLRTLAITGGLALHVGIFLTMRVGVFSLVMPLCYLLFVSPSQIDRATAWVRRRLGAAAPRPVGAPPAPAIAPRHRDRILLAGLALQFGFMIFDQAAQALSFRLPKPVALELVAVGQRQNWRMFAPDAPTVDVTWTAPGELVDGRPVELTDVVAPELKMRGGFRYSRWHRLRSTLVGQPQDLMHGIGRYLCRRWNGEVPGAKLARFALTAHMQARLPPGPTRTIVMLRQECLPPASARP